MKFEMIFGVIKGYGHNNEGGTYNQVVQEIRELLERHYKKTNVFIGGSLSEQKTLYHMDWGCPEEGELTFKFEGSHNSNFSSLKSWKENVMLIAEKIKQHFQQSTMTVEFIETEFHYLNNKEDINNGIKTY